MAASASVAIPIMSGSPFPHGKKRTQMISKTRTGIARAIPTPARKFILPPFGVPGNHFPGFLWLSRPLGTYPAGRSSRLTGRSLPSDKTTSTHRARVHSGPLRARDIRSFILLCKRVNFKKSISLISYINIYRNTGYKSYKTPYI